MVHKEHHMALWVLEEHGWKKIYIQSKARYLNDYTNTKQFYMLNITILRNPEYCGDFYL